jgi:hypothetical protein
LADRYDEEMDKDKTTSDTDNRAPVHVSGWLKKKSPKKYSGLQVKF